MIEYLFLILGLALLYKGADWLVEGSSSLAKKFGISSLVIGLTIVAFGTSMPELIVNIFAALKGNAEVSYGNILGSSIFNLLLILGLAGTITPLVIKKSTVWKEIPFSLLAALALFMMSNEIFLNNETANTLTRGDGILLLLFFGIFLVYIFKLMKQDRQDRHGNEDKIKKYPGIKLFFLICGGLAALFIGGKLTVDSGVAIARQWGVSELLISATIIAGGTSLPELVTSIIAATKKEMDISVGNIVGSNIFNIFLVMGISSVISPISAPAGINADFFVLIAATLLLFFFMFIGTKHKLDRWQAVVFLLGYAAYTVFLITRG